MEGTTSLTSVGEAGDMFDQSYYNAHGLRRAW
jgi:hypothetical protein